jgi:hypothetical protein
VTDRGELEQLLQRVLEAHGLLCGALIRVSGEIVTRLGDFEGLKYTGLVSSLLEKSPKDTFDFLDGQILPKTFMQGEDFAVMDRPRPDLAVVVFGSGLHDTGEKLRLARDVSRTIRLEFGVGGAASGAIQ